MNTITIMSDEHSQQMMQFVAGGIVKTPNLDRLAAESVVFSNCYSPCPVCAPARASFYTGQFVHRLGTWDNATPYDGTVPGMGHHLRAFGRETICIGKTHFHHQGDYAFAHQEFAGYMHHADVGCFFRDQKLGRVNAQRRFTGVSIKTEESYDDRVLESAINWLLEHKEQEFNLYIGFLDPHFPFKVKQENWDYFSSRITTLPDALKPPFTSLNEPLSWLRTYFKGEQAREEDILKLLIAYHCAVAELDERLGLLLDTLDRLGLRENTALFYTSDHGEQMGYHGLWWKCCMFQQSANVPLLVRVPGIAPKRVSHPVNLVDIFPTIAALCGLPPPTNISGESLLPLLKAGEDKDRRDFTFSEYHAHGMPCGMFMIRWENWKYVFFCDYPPQLFDLAADPREDRDLVPQSAHDEALKKVLAACHQRLISICDPFLVDARAKEFQARTKVALGITGYDSDFIDAVPHPENTLGIEKYREEGSV